MKRYAIVGFGCAGYSGARALRRTDPSGEIHVWEAGGEPPANPMLTTYYASQKLKRGGAFPFGNLDTIAGELNLCCHMNTVVEHVNATEHTLITSKGSTEAYDGILLATGARAFVPPLDGLPDERVYLMRTMADAEKLKARLTRGIPKKSVVVGASMVGIKVAELLWKAGSEVTIADGAGWLFPLAAYENVGREVERRLLEKGYRFCWSAMTKAIVPKGVAFEDGRVLEADLIAMCIGTRANTDIVRGEPIQVGKGIVVDRHMQTSCPGIYAAGDCCEGIERQSGNTAIIGLWANAAGQGETAGACMAGENLEYAGNILHNITHFMDMDFIGLGDTRLVGETLEFGDIGSDCYICAVVKNGRIQSANILGNYRIAGTLKTWLLRQLERPEEAIPERMRANLLRMGISDDFIARIGGNGK